MSTPKTLYEIRITLTGAKPPVWRRVRVDPDRSLGFLHAVIQAAMGWGDGHLHGFEQKHRGSLGRHLCPRGTGFDPDRDEDEEAVTLRRVCPHVKDALLYEYDFGDSWRHRITVSKVVDAKPGERTPVCLSGKGACPPEDCGGLWGYGDLVEALADPDHPDHAEQVELWGDGFDPAACSVDEVNARLEGLRSGVPEPAAGDGADGGGGEVWRAHLGRIDVDELVASSPEALLLRVARPPGGYPKLWYVAYGREGDPAGEAGGLGLTPDLADAEARAEEGIRTLCERPGGGVALPGLLRVSDPRMVGWFPGLVAEGVRVEVAAALDDADRVAAEVREELLMKLLESMPGGMGGAGGEDADGPVDAPPMGSGRGVTDDDLRAFHAAAAAFAEAAPWRGFPSGAFVEVVRPKPPAGMKLFSLFVDDEGFPSVNFAKSLAVAEAMCSPQTDDQLLAQLGRGMWSVDFLSPENVFEADLDEVDRLDLPLPEVGREEVVPTLTEFNGTAVGRASGPRLRFVTGLLRALAEPPEPTLRASLGRSTPRAVGDFSGSRTGGFEFRLLKPD